MYTALAKFRSWYEGAANEVPLERRAELQHHVVDYMTAASRSEADMQRDLDATLSKLCLKGAVWSVTSDGFWSGTALVATASHLQVLPPMPGDQQEASISKRKARLYRREWSV